MGWRAELGGKKREKGGGGMGDLAENLLVEDFKEDPKPDLGDLCLIERVGSSS